MQSREHVTESLHAYAPGAKACHPQLANNNAWLLARFRLRLQNQLAHEPGHIPFAEKQKAQVGCERALARPTEVNLRRIPRLRQLEGYGGHRMRDRNTPR